MIKKHYLRIILLFFILLFFLTSHIVYADDIDDSKETIEPDIVEATTSIVSAESSSREPSINSRAYIVLDRNSNRVLLGKNENQRRKMASTTKIMTATIIIENCNLNETIEISKKSASVGGSKLGLKTSDKITIRDLLYGLMLRSGNDCAIALAEYAGGSIEGFSDLMNSKSDELRFKRHSFRDTTWIR